MKVALVADTFCVEKGTGIARYSQELLHGLAGHDLEVEAICPVPPSLPFGLAINHAVKMPYRVRSQANRFDLIHATSPITALAFPVISRPKVVTYHDLFSLAGRRTGTALHTRLSAPFFLRTGRYADCIIANSWLTKEEMVDRLGIEADKITVVNWGINEMFRHRPGANRQAHVIGYVGALNRRKGLPYLIRAVHILTNNHPRIAVKVAICGRRDLEYPKLVRLTAELDLNQTIEFRGFISDDQLVHAYNSFDVFALPSQWEGFGLPILEAQRCGVPVIIREDAHIPAEVSKCCLKADSQQDMADKIYRLLMDESLRQTIVEEGLEYSQRFTWERTVQETLKVYEQALS